MYFMKKSDFKFQLETKNCYLKIIKDFLLFLLVLILLTVYQINTKQMCTNHLMGFPFD